LAAYNCGSNCVQNAIDETGLTDYWDLAETGLLPRETIAYIPKFVALLNLVEKAESLGYADWRPYSYTWVLLPVPKPIHLYFLARSAGVDSTLLSLGNAELLAGATPFGYSDIRPAPNGKNRSVYHLKVPEIYAEIISSSLHIPEVQMAEYMVHRIKPGDTLSFIARKYGVSVDSVRNFNPGIQPRYLQINTAIIVPDVGSSQNSHRHVVQSGETLSQIAVRYETSVESLTRINKISDPNTIYPGLSLSVPRNTR
jgi:membrane-bound lytic murein transglycosylase D